MKFKRHLKAGWLEAEAGGSQFKATLVLGYRTGSRTSYTKKLSQNKTKRGT